MLRSSALRLLHSRAAEPELDPWGQPFLLLLVLLHVLLLDPSCCWLFVTVVTEEACVFVVATTLLLEENLQPINSALRLYNWRRGSVRDFDQNRYWVVDSIRCFDNCLL